ncbi:MAG: HAD hydrolase-like protein [Bacteroidetes bacterium]|nr:HAD hydrolase-like protein [Bacteroidota bacterium]
MQENSQPSGQPILVLFDVDGTLINSYEFDTELFVQAVREVTGMVIHGDWSSYTYVSDGGVLQEEIARQGLSGNADEWERKVKERFTALTREHLQEANGNLEKPGARDFVEHMLQRSDCAVGVATGGWGGTARLKLQHIGLGSHLASGKLALATSSDHHNRLSIMRLAERRAKANWVAQTTDVVQPKHHKIYFGDGPWDQRACADLGFHFIAIGNRIEHPHRFDDFLDQQALLQAAGLLG